MSDEKQEWQALIPELLKDWWHTNDALWLFVGCKLNTEGFTNIDSSCKIWSLENDRPTEFIRVTGSALRGY